MADGDLRRAPLTAVRGVSVGEHWRGVGK